MCLAFLHCMLSNICPNGLPKSMKISFVGILYEFFSLCIFNIVRRCILTFVAYVCYVHGTWLLKEGVKYYFADFVREGGTPPFSDFFLARREIWIWGVPPYPPLRICWRTFFFKTVTDLGGTPTPLQTKSAK